MIARTRDQKAHIVVLNSPGRVNSSRKRFGGATTPLALEKIRPWVHHNNNKEKGSRSETSMTYLSVIADGQRLRSGGVVVSGNSGEATVDNGGCGGVHRRWL
ncbi:unnamed protein product [Lactuca saligna]|uniref:Uncharacterized protein n=1 Tax=Lactuca saligna TaxID=75948 RepID=A0AA35Y3R8_LACSI|nr:unnamed protein product [Lactuca saligna]